MAAPAGISAQLGFKSESTYGTEVTVDQFHAGFLSESLKQDIARVNSSGLRAGRYTTHKWCNGVVGVGGQVSLELWDEPLATLLGHMFGTVNTSGAGPYTHTASPGPLEGESFTMQVGRPDIGGTVRPFTYAGCKVASWTLTAAVGEIAKLDLDVAAQSETTGTALASASYPTSAPFCFVAGSLSIGGTDVAVLSDMSITGNNALATDRHRIGAATVREPLQNGMREYTGTLTADFEDLTNYGLYTAGTESALVMTFDNGTDSLTITCNVRFDGETPAVSGPEMLTQNLPFVCLSDTSDAAAITAVLVNGEASAA